MTENDIDAILDLDRRIEEGISLKEESNTTINSAFFKPRKLRRKTNEGTRLTKQSNQTDSSEVTNNTTNNNDQGQLLQEVAVKDGGGTRAHRKHRYTMSTTERSIAAKIYFEHYFDRLFAGKSTSPAVSSSRTRRRLQIEQELERLGLSDTDKSIIREEFLSRERVLTRIAREKLTIDLFELIRPLGKGAFGFVQLVREKATGQVYAMKMLKKEMMLKDNQESHVRAERDLLIDAADESRWLVKLIYSFQDLNNLYFVMEYLPGGDLLSLLITYDTFPEAMCKFYISEMVLCIEETHKMGYVHRDIKPDNFLLDARGHLRLGDCGLATDFHWSHETQYYEVLRKHAYKIRKNEGEQMELDNEQKELDDYIAFTQSDNPLTGQDEGNLHHGTNPSEIFCKVPPEHKVLTWRAKARGKNPHMRTYSVVGTNNYIAPEVLQAKPYDHSCDWWSMGVIIFEMLYGYPPFASKTREGTKQKILEFNKWLKFPNYVTNIKSQNYSYGGVVSKEAKDLIRRLLSHKEERLGGGIIFNKPSEDPLSAIFNIMLNGRDAADVKKHPWFKEVDFNRIHDLPAPWIPALNSDVDTRYFDQTVQEAGLVGVYATAFGNAVATDEKKKKGKHKSNKSKDDMDVSYGSGEPKKKPSFVSENSSVTSDDEEVLNLRKKLAFVGFTYKGSAGAANRVESLNRQLSLERS